MTKGFVFDTTKFVWQDGSRVAMTSAGDMVSLLPTKQTFSATLTFSDPPKDRVYLWTYDVAEVPLSSPTTFQKGEGCTSWVAATPQEQEVVQVLDTPPSGAELFLGRVRLHRSTAPLSTWRGRTLGVLPKQDQWLPWYGSCKIEEEDGITRLMHLYLDAADSYKLKLVAEQSVVDPPNGFGTFGHMPPGISNPTGNGGGELVNKNGVNGFPIMMIQSKSRGYDAPVSGSAAYGGSAGSPSQFRVSGTSPCSTADATNYQSVYTVDVELFYGKAS